MSFVFQLRDETPNCIRVCSISPRTVRTAFAEAFFPDAEDPAARASDLFATLPHLRPEDVAEAAAFTIGARPDVQVMDVQIAPVNAIY